MGLFTPMGFTDQTETDGTRYDGGAFVKNHRYVKGYFYVFVGLPPFIFDKAGVNLPDAAKWLTTTAKSFTPHGDPQMKIADEQNLGGVGNSFLTGVTVDRNFSITFKEYWGSPIRKIFDILGSYINPYVGASCIADEFVPNEYKSTIVIVQTKPVARNVSNCTVQKAWTENDIIGVNYYDGVIAKSRPSSMFDENLEDNSLVEIPMSFSFDGFPLTEANEGVLGDAVTLLESMDLFKKTEEKYNKLFANMTAVSQGSKGG